MAGRLGRRPAATSTRSKGRSTAVSETALTLATPYAGTLVLPRDRRRSMRVQGSGRRIVIDPTAHHLGDDISTTAPLIDPPQPEGGILERSVELSEIPARPAALVLDVVQVVGEAQRAPVLRTGPEGRAADERHDQRPARRLPEPAHHLQERDPGADPAADPRGPAPSGPEPDPVRAGGHRQRPDLPRRPRLAGHRPGIRRRPARATATRARETVT